MKAVAAKSNATGSKANFYVSTLAPINYRREVQFHAADVVMLIVLFLEIGVLSRLFLAN
jgi:hypothetical protein